jgi:hypothetical protein
VYELVHENGPGQLMSGQAGESIGTFRVVLDRMRGCQGRATDSDGNMSGVGCTRKLGEGDKELIKDMEQVIKDSENTFIKTKISPGMGPIGWWLGRGIGGQKPSWWDRTGPGRFLSTDSSTQPPTNRTHSWRNLSFYKGIFNIFYNLFHVFYQFFITFT